MKPVVIFFVTRVVLRLNRSIHFLARGYCGSPIQHPALPATMKSIWKGSTFHIFAKDERQNRQSHWWVLSDRNAWSSERTELDPWILRLLHLTARDHGNDTNGCTSDEGPRQSSCQVLLHMPYIVWWHFYLIIGALGAQATFAKDNHNSQKLHMLMHAMD